jgi:hypothetical protein
MGERRLIFLLLLCVLLRKQRLLGADVSPTGEFDSSFIKFRSHLVSRQSVDVHQIFLSLKNHVDRMLSNNLEILSIISTVWHANFLRPMTTGTLRGPRWSCESRTCTIKISAAAICSMIFVSLELPSCFRYNDYRAGCTWLVAKLSTSKLSSLPIVNNRGWICSVLNEGRVSFSFKIM